MKSVGIIGTGNMGASLLQLLRTNYGKSSMFISVSDIQTIKSHTLAQKYDVWDGTNTSVISDSEIIFLAIKPNDIKEVCGQIRDVTQNTTERKTIISLVAGISTQHINMFLSDLDYVSYFNNEQKNNEKYEIIRCMPTLNIGNGSGCVFWYGSNDGSDISNKNKEMCYDMLHGPTHYWVSNESLIDNSTVVFGCSPAYMAYFVQLYVEVGYKYGFNKEITSSVINNIMGDTSNMIQNEGFENVIQRVSSKGGVTEASLNSLKFNEMEKIINESFKSGLNKLNKIKNNLD